MALGLVGPGIYAHDPDVPFPKTRDPKYREWSTLALQEAKRLGCSYADIRFTLNRSHGLFVRNGQLRSAAGQGDGNFGNVGDTDTYGFGVRVIHGGVWGFASSPIVTPEEIRRVTGIAADVARASAVAKKIDVRLAPVPAYDTFWETPITVNPWDVPLEDKLALLVDTTTTMQKTKGVLFAIALVNFNYEWKYLATSEGSFIEQVLFYTTCGCSATAVAGAQVKTRSFQPGSMTRGYEFVTESDMRGQAERVAAEAVEFAMAKPVGAGLKDLVLLPSHLALTIHEIIAHPTELDRIVGYEANYAGTSFVKCPISAS